MLPKGKTTKVFGIGLEDRKYQTRIDSIKTKRHNKGCNNRLRTKKAVNQLRQKDQTGSQQAHSKLGFGESGLTFL